MEKIKIDFGTIINEVRKETGETQRKYAERVGVTPNTLCNMCNGLSIPNIYVAYRMCKALGLNIQSVCELAFENIEVYSIEELFDLIATKRREEVEKNIKKWKEEIKKYERGDFDY